MNRKFHTDSLPAFTGRVLWEIYAGDFLTSKMPEETYKYNQFAKKSKEVIGLLAGHTRAQLR